MIHLAADGNDARPNLTRWGDVLHRGTGTVGRQGWLTQEEGALAAFQGRQLGGTFSGETSSLQFVRPNGHFTSDYSTTGGQNQEKCEQIYS